MNEFSSIMLLVVTSTLRMAVPYILATTGAAFSMRAGVSDLGCEGMMIAGAFFAALGTYLTQNPWVGLLFGAFFGALIAMVHGVLHISYKVNQTISGMCVNLLGAAMVPLLLQIIWGVKGNSPTVPKFDNLDFEWLAKIPVIGPILTAQNILFYLTLVLVFIGHIYLFKTPAGLRMRMVSEHPQAASTVGLNVYGYKYLGVILSGAFCGLGGAYLSLGQLNLFMDGMTAGRGYIAIVINAFGRYTPIGALLGSLFFGFFESLQVVFQGAAIPNQVVMMTPYVLTLLVVTFGLRGTRAPAGVGKHHDL